MFIFHFRFLISIFTLVVVGIVLISAGIIMTRRVSARIPLAYPLALIVCTAGAEIAISLIWRPIFHFRIIMWTVPFFYILASLTITSIGSSRAIGVLVSGVAAIFILDLWAHYRKPVAEDYRTLADEVYTASWDGDVIITTHPWIYTAITYYLAKHSPRALVVVDRSTLEMRAVGHLPPAPVEPLPPATHRIWLIGGSAYHQLPNVVVNPEFGAEFAPYRLVRRYDEHNVSAELYQDSAARP